MVKQTRWKPNYHILDGLLSICGSFKAVEVLINIKKMISKERGTIILSITLLTVQTSLGIMSK